MLRKHNFCAKPSFQMQKPAAPIGTTGNKSFTRHEEWAGVVGPVRKKSYARRLHSVYRRLARLLV
jgi:hypothetical protein